MKVSVISSLPSAIIPLNKLSGVMISGFLLAPEYSPTIATVGFVITPPDANFGIDTPDNLFLALETKLTILFHPLEMPFDILVSILEIDVPILLT